VSESNVIELRGYQDKMKGFTKRLDTLEQVVMQIDANVAAFSLGVTITLEAMKRLLIDKKIFTEDELESITNELAESARAQMIDMMRQKVEQKNNQVTGNHVSQ